METEDVTTGVRRHTNSCYFTMVALATTEPVTSDKPHPGRTRSVADGPTPSAAGQRAGRRNVLVR